MAVNPTLVVTPSSSFSQRGFKLLSKKPCFLPKTIAGPDYYEIPGTGKFVRGSTEGIRAKPPSGVFPNSKLRYLFYAETLPANTNDATTSVAAAISTTATLLTRGLLPTPILTVEFQRSVSITSVVCFEGMDVIDLPKENFKRSDQGIVVDHNVYKVIYAGANKLIPDKDEKGFNYWTTVGPYLPTNLCRGTTLTDDAPVDLKYYYKANKGDPTFADTASNVITTQGTANYVSYVAITKPLFRDVVYMTGSTETTGYALLGTYRELNTRQAMTTLPAIVLRYAWVNMAKKDDPPKFMWRLAESFNARPGKVAPALGIKTQAGDVPDHYVYNLLDDVKPELAETSAYPPEILKTAYLQQDAVALSTPGNKNYNKKFQFFMMPQDFQAEVVAGGNVLVANSAEYYPSGNPALLAGLGALCASTIWADSAQGMMEQISAPATQCFVYTSSKITQPFIAITRLGTEYYSNFINGRMLTAQEFALLARVHPGGGVSAVLDPCTFMTSVFDILPTTNTDIVTERVFDDFKIGNVSSLPPETAAGGKFLLGEFPLRTEGGTALVPPQDNGKAGDSPLTLDKEKFVTMLSIAVSTESEDETFRLYANTDTSGNPLVELNLGEFVGKLQADGKSDNIIVGVPPTKTTSFAWKAGGGFGNPKSYYFVEKDAVMAGELVPHNDGQTLPWTPYSDFQVKRVGKQTFPVTSQSVAASANCATGYVLFAYENDGRIDLAVRTGHGDAYAFLRDVTLRVPDDDNFKPEAYDSAYQSAYQTAKNSGKSEEDAVAAGKAAGNKAAANDISKTRAEEINMPPSTLPFLVDDKSTKNLVLFYMYKDKLLAKRVPEEALGTIIRSTEANSFTPAAEAKNIKMMHGLIPAIVYDGANEGKSAASILKDLKLGAVKVFQGDPPKTDKKPDYVVQFCAMADSTGNLYAVIQTGTRVMVKRSVDGGEVWESVFPDDFSFYPNRTSGGTDATAAAQVQSPFVMLDWSTQNCIMTFVVEGSLLAYRFPAEVLRVSKDKAAATLSKYLEPKVLFGPLTQDMADRGISYGTAVPEHETAKGSTVPVQVLSHRMTGVVAQNGYYRVFFKDDESRLRSLISTDLGSSWLLDQDFVKLRGSK